MKKERLSLKGWSLKRWLVGNKNIVIEVKELVKLLIPGVLAWSQAYHPGWVALITIGGKLVLDAAEYAIKRK